MARLYFPGGSPIGRRFGAESDPSHAADFEVIGVVQDAKYVTLDESPQPAAYYLYSQILRQFYYDFEVRYSGDQRAIMAEVRSAAASVDPSLPTVYQGTLAEQVRGSVASQSLVARLSRSRLLAHLVLRGSTSEWLVIRRLGRLWRVAPVLAKASKAFLLIDCVALGVDRIQCNFEPCGSMVEAWK